MKNSKSYKLLIVLLVLTMSIGMFTGCAKEKEKNAGTEEKISESSITEAELSQSEIDSLMEQISKSHEKRYEEYMPDEIFSNAKVFGVDREGDKGKAYVRLFTGEYVELKGKAYNISGGSGECIIHFDYTENGVKLDEVEWSADGGAHESWMQENFPAEYLFEVKNYEAYNENGESDLFKKQIKDVEEKMGVPVERENLLMIDEDEGTYEIVKTIESGEPGKDYKFEVQTLEAGKLEDL